MLREIKMNRRVLREVVPASRSRLMREIESDPRALRDPNRDVRRVGRRRFLVRKAPSAGQHEEMNRPERVPIHRSTN